MKKQLFYLVVLAAFSQGCSSCTSMKVYRTVQKSVNLSYNFSPTGTSTSSASLTSGDIYALFSSVDGTIEKVDISGVSLSGDINAQQNTATEASLSANITKQNSTYLLLKTSKLIKTSENGLGTDILGTDGKYVTLNNALNSLNAEGLSILSEFCRNAIVPNRAHPGQPPTISTQPPLDMKATAVVPLNQRLVGTIYIRISASVTYFKCEPMYSGLLYNDTECSQ